MIFVSARFFFRLREVGPGAIYRRFQILYRGRGAGYRVRRHHGGFKACLRIRQRGLGGLLARHGAFKLLAATRAVAQFLHALEFLLGAHDFRLRRLDLRAGGGDGQRGGNPRAGVAMPAAAELGLGAGEVALRAGKGDGIIARVDLGDDVAGMHELVIVHLQRDDIALDLGCHGDHMRVDLRVIG